MSRWGRIQRVDGPAPGTVALELYAPTVGRRVLVLAPNGLSWHATRPRGLPADGFVRRLRKLLTGAVVLRAERGERGPRLMLRARDADLALAAEDGAVVLRRAADGHPLAARRRVARQPLSPASAIAPEDLHVERTPQAPLEGAQRRELRRRLVRLRKKLLRRLQAIADDEARAQRAPALRHEAELIVAHLDRYEPSSARLEVVDWGTQPASIRELAVDPRLGAAATAEALFRQAKRFERGAEIAAQRARSTRDELARVEEALHAFEARDTEELRALLAELDPRPLRRASDRKPTERRPFRRFLAHGDQVVLVGRGARDNDRLTLGARPHDHWLHARGAQGAHVIVPLQRNRTIGPELLADAAMLAAHFSRRRGEEVVEVQHTPRRHVRKPKGAPPGAVRVDREKVIAVRVDPRRLEWLLGRERG